MGERGPYKYNSKVTPPYLISWRNINLTKKNELFGCSENFFLFCGRSCVQFWGKSSNLREYGLVTGSTGKGKKREKREEKREEKEGKFR